MVLVAPDLERSDPMVEAYELVLRGDDLGAALGTSASTAAVRLFRARSRLKERYEQEGGDRP